MWGVSYVENELARKKCHLGGVRSRFALSATPEEAQINICLILMRLKKE